MKLLITALTISSITFVSGCGSGLPYVSEEDVIGSWTHQCDDNYDNCPSCDIYGSGSWNITFNKDGTFSAYSPLLQPTENGMSGSYSIEGHTMMLDNLTVDGRDLGVGPVNGGIYDNSHFQENSISAPFVDLQGFPIDISVTKSHIASGACCIRVQENSKITIVCENSWSKEACDLVDGTYFGDWTSCKHKVCPQLDADIYLDKDPEHSEPVEIMSEDWIVGVWTNKAINKYLHIYPDGRLVSYRGDDMGEEMTYQFTNNTLTIRDGNRDYPAYLVRIQQDPKSFIIVARGTPKSFEKMVSELDEDEREDFLESKRYELTDEALPKLLKIFTAREIASEFTKNEKRAMHNFKELGTFTLRGTFNGFSEMIVPTLLGELPHQTLIIADNEYGLNGVMVDIYGDSEDKFYDLDKGSRAEFKVKYIYFNGNMALFDLVE